MAQMNEKFIEFMCEKVYGDENYNYTKQDYRNLLRTLKPVWTEEKCLSKGTKKHSTAFLEGILEMWEQNMRYKLRIDDLVKKQKEHRNTEQHCNDLQKRIIELKNENTINQQHYEEQINVKWEDSDPYKKLKMKWTLESQKLNYIKSMENEIEQLKNEKTNSSLDNSEWVLEKELQFKLNTEKYKKQNDKELEKHKIEIEKNCEKTIKELVKEHNREDRILIKSQEKAETKMLKEEIKQLKIKIKKLQNMLLD